MKHRRIRYKLVVQAVLSGAFLFEAVGCPQLISQSVILGTRSFLETGLPTVLLQAFGFDELLSTDSGGE